MWSLLSRCKALTKIPLLSALATSQRCATASLFHVLAGTSVNPTSSPLANQCTTQHHLVQKPTVSGLLQPAAGPLLTCAAGFKVKGRLKRRCKDCYFVVRQQRLFVICKTHPRHKQMSMKKHERNTWILTDATQSPVRAW